MKKLVLFALILLLSSTTLSAQKLCAVRNKVENGYNFWLYTPGGYKDYRAERQKQKVDKTLPAALPIVIFLHGRSLSGTDLNKVREYGTLEALAGGRKINAIVIAPQVKSGESWRPNRVMNVVKWVSERYDVDMSRIYVLGMSLGGYGTLDFAAAYPKETAAAIALCGGSTRKTADLACLNEVPLWIMHGTADKAVPVSQSRRVYNAMKAANKNTPRLRYDEFAGVGHSLFARVMYTGEAYEWLFKHSTTDPSRKVDRTIQIPQSRLTNQPYRGLNFRGSYLTVVNNLESFPAVMTPNPVQKQTSKPAQKPAQKQTEKPVQKQPQKTEQKSQSQYHTITAGDTLGAIARKYNTTVKQICEWNNITETTVLQINKKLRVRGESAKHQYHTVVAGDTLYGLARKYNTTVKQICEWNNITETAVLQINKKLRVK